MIFQPDIDRFLLDYRYDVLVAQNEDDGTRTAVPPNAKLLPRAGIWLH